MPASSDNKSTLAYTPSQGGPPTYTPPAAAPGGYAPQQQQYPQQPYPQQPQQGYAPQPQPQSYPSQQSAAQVGEAYRAQLFAQCAQGIHQPSTKYGICGIITAIVCFPIGLICLFTDTEQKCDRCGIKLS
ncbi:hypothetical protein C8F04DRAFT_1062016 [Mycena alexandri]|uniref:Brain protein I3 n=1 Tax=Mycena alexandri TaxID=1745969 RepID=A0AAD6XG78_9AGAR|nr:hypothetical protein C8F04DRAFT_1062016 [Mycena alexandri]